MYGYSIGSADDHGNVFTGGHGDTHSEREKDMTGPELRTRREVLGLTQQALAERLGIDSMTVSRWERGEHGIPPYLHLALLEIANNPLWHGLHG